eukprot:CAMPEP_0183551376 /NCGR_PEP_ID=MMETSP0371-20130417/68667_1 /TAXON_ID=268820 /ORGANISM="Peridinium aciculiferum, Strain PAER-2" /LENGTH=70 /DNA_ID=CAMNT_0025755907 /DNA_START=35 /DNA_END=244 /DNA_ORIENTATION=+
MCRRPNPPAAGQTWPMSAPAGGLPDLLGRLNDRRLRELALVAQAAATRALSHPRRILLLTAVGATNGAHG